MLVWGNGHPSFVDQMRRCLICFGIGQGWLPCRTGLLFQDERCGAGLGHWFGCASAVEKEKMKQPVYLPDGLMAAVSRSCGW
jgi:hypothetical protein